MDMTHEESPLIRYGYAIYLAFTAAWCIAYALVAPGEDAVLRGIVSWALLVMIIATSYYFIQRICRPPAGSVVISLRWEGLIALAAAIGHPLLVDYHHCSHGPLKETDPSPIPWYVPRVCLPIDWTMAAIVGVALAVF